VKYSKSGDCIVIKSGTYHESLRISKSIKLIADEGATVDVIALEGSAMVLRGEDKKAYIAGINFLTKDLQSATIRIIQVFSDYWQNLHCVRVDTY
jgi:hypothetical protein